jgi:primary-amine oxidase
MFQAASIVRQLFPGKCLNFRVITLKEPPKQDMIVFLEEEHLGQKTSLRPLRTSRVEVIARGDSETTELIELLVDLDHAAVVKQEVLVGKHSYIDSAYMKAVENACLADERVQSEVERLKLPPGASVVVEAWAYATDGMNDMSERTSMVTTS